MNTENNNETENKVNPQNTEPSYLIPGSIVIAGILIALAIFAGKAPVQPVSDQLPFTKLGQAVSAASVPPEVLKCEFDKTYDSSIQADMDNFVITGGRGTPWTIVVDNQTGDYFPINGALPASEILRLVENGFSDAEFDDEAREMLANVTPVTVDDYYRGPDNPRYTFIEYSDFDCPFCARFHESMIEVMATTSDVGWVYRHFPLEQIHPDARGVANVAECVGENGTNDDAFWEFTDAYFSL